MIKQSIKKLTEGRTSIIIAHRIATIQNADKILVLDQGRIVESGTHSDLLEQRGIAVDCLSYSLAVKCLNFSFKNCPVALCLQLTISSGNP